MADPPIITSATKEWVHWGKSAWNCISGKKSKGHHIDDEDKYAKYVIDTYVSLFYSSPIKWPTVSVIGNDDYAWSAVTISYLHQQGGFSRKTLPKKPYTTTEYADWVNSSTSAEFPYSEAHADYIRWAIAARKQNIKTAAYWGYRVDDKLATPEPGDLIGYARAKKKITHAQALKFFDKTSNYMSHTDLVVAKRAKEIDVIGGNVRDSVTKKTIAINAKGQIADTLHAWFVVLKRRASA